MPSVFRAGIYFSHRFPAAFFATSARRSGVMALALGAWAPLPSAFAAGSLPSSGMVSSIASGNPHDMNGVADYVSGALLALRPGRHVHILSRDRLAHRSIS